MILMLVIDVVVKPMVGKCSNGTDHDKEYVRVIALWEHYGGPQGLYLRALRGSW